MKQRDLSGLVAIVVHHSASPRATTLDQIRHWHVDRNGWESIGYHAVIDGQAEVHLCRRLDTVGAHCRDHNLTTIGVCVTGDNTQHGERWSGHQIRALIAYVRALRAVLGPLEVLRHRDLMATLCPGLDDAEWVPLKQEMIDA